MNIPKHVLNCPWVGQQHDILSFCEHLILILRLSSILSQNDNSVWQSLYPQRKYLGAAWCRLTVNGLRITTTVFQGF